MNWLFPFSYWRNALLLASLWALGSCGFKLRGDQPLPVGISQIAVADVVSHSHLKRALNKRLKLYQIPRAAGVDEENQAYTIGIMLLPDRLDRRLLSLFTTGQVAEYELILSIKYDLLFPNKEPQRIEFTLTQEYQDDPDAILAKSRELDLVLSEMREQAADRIIRLLASQSPALD